MNSVKGFYGYLTYASALEAVFQQFHLRHRGIPGPTNRAMPHLVVNWWRSFVLRNEGKMTSDEKLLANLESIAICIQLLYPIERDSILTLLITHSYQLESASTQSRSIVVRKHGGFQASARSSSRPAPFLRSVRVVLMCYYMIIWT